MPTILTSDSVPVSDERDYFNPPRFSDAELVWLSDHIGQPPVVAFRDALPPAVNIAAVRPVIERVYELIELEKHNGSRWVGPERVREAIATYLSVSTEWRKRHAVSPRARPRWPSLHQTDMSRRLHRGGVGSDANVVSSYEDQNGTRKFFAIALTTPYGEAPEERDEVPTLPAGINLSLVEEPGVLFCPVCRFSRTFSDDSSSSRNVARAQMARHLKTATKEPDWHRAVYNQEFGS